MAKREILEKFVEKHPNHYLTKTIESILYSNTKIEEAVDYIKTQIRWGLRQQTLFGIEANQADILIANLDLQKE